MTRILKTSGFAGLTVMMLVGLYQNYLLASGEVVPQWLIGGHAHLGVLSILAIVVGFAIPAVGVTGRLRTAVTGMFVAGQWGLPLTPWLAEGGGLEFLLPVGFLWGGLLVASMGIMAVQAATQADVTDGSSGLGSALADD